MYETYKVLKTKEQYFQTWSKDQLKHLTEERKDEIHQKYLVKGTVFQRDNFKCRNETCQYPDSKLTLHHTKFVKNNGKWSLKNCITICKTCHQKYHRGKDTLTYDGMTYQIHKEPNRIDVKLEKNKNKLIRKSNKSLYGVTISWELMELLIKFLFNKDLQYNCNNEYEDEDTVDDDK